MVRKRRLTEAKIQKAILLRERGFSYNEIAERVNIGRPAITNALKERNIEVRSETDAPTTDGVMPDTSPTGDPIRKNGIDEQYIDKDWIETNTVICGTNIEESFWRKVKRFFWR